ncbi:MAG TPA: hypothetical protein VLN09_06315 [Psychrobacter sp.]|uniref:hypothetical protein n=1 Tax=Psychrobacter sp. TaxID=56811 RepID=UPI002C7B81AC|nr:hypothetical protein [Psychrobacter sp.]HSP85343.1 hypothetical protein [Psychrobacter sp.]
MKILKLFSLKTAIPASLALALVGVTAGCAVAGPGYKNYPIYNDNSGYSQAENNRAIQQLRQDLRRKGYDVMDIRTDSYRGNRILIVLAKKNNQAYELKYTSPDLRLIISTKKPWSNAWDDYKNDYQDKDSIKNEARYPVIKRRAINKVESMGYRVKNIEFEQKNNRGVFEIEAKRGSQEYEIVLGYPNLNVIKIKKD